MSIIIGLAQGQSPVQWFHFVLDDGSGLTVSPQDVMHMYNARQAYREIVHTPPLVESASGHLEMLRDNILAHNARITKLEKEIQQIMNLVTVDKNQVDAVSAAVTTLTGTISTALTDTGTALADIAAKIAALQGTTADPTTATELGSILTAVQAQQASVQNLDAQVKAADPGPIAPVTPTPTPAPAAAVSSMEAGGASHTVVESTPGGNKVVPKTTE